MSWPTGPAAADGGDDVFHQSWLACSDPQSRRRAPLAAQQMPAFDDTTLPDSAIDAVIAYMHYLATRSK